jgi:hypothetical protein
LLSLYSYCFVICCLHLLLLLLLLCFCQVEEVGCCLGQQPLLVVRQPAFLQDVKALTAAVPIAHPALPLLLLTLLLFCLMH